MYLNGTFFLPPLRESGEGGLSKGKNFFILVSDKVKDFSKMSNPRKSSEFPFFGVDIFGLAYETCFASGNIMVMIFTFPHSQSMCLQQSRSHSPDPERYMTWVCHWTYSIPLAETLAQEKEAD